MSRSTKKWQKKTSVSCRKTEVLQNLYYAKLAFGLGTARQVAVQGRHAVKVILSALYDLAALIVFEIDDLAGAGHDNRFRFGGAGGSEKGKEYEGEDGFGVCHKSSGCR